MEKEVNVDGLKTGNGVPVLAKMEPGLEIVFFEHCGHLVMWDAEEEFNKRTAVFLNRLQACDSAR